MQPVPEDTLMVMCRSGRRSAIAANMLAKAGFKNVYNIIDGMEGDADADSDSVAQAQPLTDGWKNSGRPWTNKLTPDRMMLPKFQYRLSRMPEQFKEISRKNNDNPGERNESYHCW
jgi:hypothetical protein